MISLITAVKHSHVGACIYLRNVYFTDSNKRILQRNYLEMITIISNLNLTKLRSNDLCILQFCYSHDFTLATEEGFLF
jgi:hypothetical protein